MKWQKQKGMVWVLLATAVMLMGRIALAGETPSVEETLLQARNGDPEAQFVLGGIYSMAHGVGRDIKQSVFWHTRAAMGGHAEAQYTLGLLYENGDGVPQHYTQALTWLGKAAEQGHLAAKAQREKILEHIESIKRSAEKGEADAQCTLGTLYATGNGVPQNDDQAVIWFRHAAEQKSAAGQYHLGVMYAEGRGASQDDKEAAAWYTKAAEQGHADAQYHLGALYHKGRGVPRDAITAYAWLSVSAAQGHEIARTNQAFAESRLTPPQLSQAQDLAADLQAKTTTTKR